MLIELKNIQKTYSSKSGVTFRALSNVSTAFDNTGLTFLVGASGSGKSTLLNVIGGLDDYDSGELSIAGRSLKDLKPAEVDSLRNTLMGFVFQEFNLIDTLSVFDNVCLALDMQSARDKETVLDALKEMGIEDKAHNKTKDLSGGQRQRVAIARALVKDPQIILADEPTGALDSATSEEVMTILKRLSETRLVIVVTHDMDAAAKFGDRIIEMKDGRIYRDVRKRMPGEVVETSDSVLYSETLLCVPQGKTVTEKDVKELNGIISGSVRKTYVNVETDPRKVKAMFPYLREAVDSGAKSNAGAADTSALDENAFVPYTPKNEQPKQFEYAKSKLPFGRTCRLALNNLNHKKFRLVLTIIIAFIAFTLFAIAESFAAYDVNLAISHTVSREHIGTLSLSSSMSSKRISDNDIKAIKEKAPFVGTVANYTLGLDCMNVDEGGNSTGLFSFRGVVEVDDISTLTYVPFAGASACPDFDSVIISRYAAMSIRREGIVNAASDGELVGMGVRLGSRVFKIAGVFDCDYLSESAESDRTLTRLYVKPGFMSDYAARLVGFDGSFKIDIAKSAGETNGDSYYDSNNLPGVTPMLASSFDMYDKVVSVTTGRIQSAYEIIISQSLLDNLPNSEVSGDFASDDERNVAKAKAINESENRKLVLRSDNLAVFVNNEFTITGIVKTENKWDTSSNIIVLHDDLRDDIFAAQAYANALFLTFDPTPENAKTVVDAVGDVGYNINEAFVKDYAMVLGLISTLKIAFFIIAGILCLLVILLLNNFISSSVKITRKQIGILRALGAKKSDTFKIYAVEGFFMSAFSLAATIVVLAFVAPLLNLLISGTFGYYFSLIAIQWFVYLTVAALAVVITVISVLIPLRKFNKISPVSAISGKDE